MEQKEGEAMEAMEAAQAQPEAPAKTPGQIEHERMEALRSAQVAYDQKIHGAGIHPESYMSGVMPQSVKELHEKIIVPLHDRIKQLEEVVGKMLGKVA